ncbi:DNRLRE domain-containing protein, partial [Patescibacteria group bacterium]|nr:DNRLRE domain-containing protein [Patescibacteria group bacterium]
MTHIKQIVKLCVGILGFLCAIGCIAVSIENDEVLASSEITLVPIADAMVREDYPDRNYGVWSDMTIGRSWNMGNYFSNSFAYIKFDLSPLNSQVVVESAYLDVYHYVRSDYASGDYVVNVAKANGSWGETEITWNNKPSFSGIYSSNVISGYGGQWFNPPQKYTFDVTQLVQKWASESSNQGMVLYKDSGNYGGFWCSRNYNDSTCFASTRPRLRITYSQNFPPNIPKQTSPLNMSVLGGDSSSLGAEVTLKVSSLGDSEGNLEGTWFYYKDARSQEWETSPIRTGSKTAQFTTFLHDGIWSWKARSKDSMGLWSDYSPTFTFTIDTAPPSRPNIIAEPEFTPGDQNTILVEASTDVLSSKIYYQLNVSEGDNCDTKVSETGWQEAREFSVSGLKHKVSYCYKAKAQDNIGNTTEWSEGVLSCQDAVLPEINGIGLDNKVFSPNDDGLFDQSTLTFQLEEDYLDYWEIRIVNAAGLVERSVQGKDLEGTFTWDGKDNDNVIVLDGPYKFDLTVFDKAGNKTEERNQVATVDNHPSILNISQPASDTWTKEESIKIAGITDLGTVLSINGQVCDIDESGMFEETKHLELGINEFYVEALDGVGNLSSEIIYVNREIDNPVGQLTFPSGTINNKQPEMIYRLADDTDDFQSGVDPDSINLSITYPNGSELLLISTGTNLQPDLGTAITDCLYTGNPLSVDCNFRYVIQAPLSQDGEYRTKLYFTDLAGNLSGEAAHNFFLDSKTYLVIETPKNNDLFSHSKITIRGQAEKDSVLSVSESNDEISFEVNEDSEYVSDCSNISKDSFGGEVCDFGLLDFELDADTEQDTDTANQIVFTITDKAGNSLNFARNVYVNLYAVNLSISTDLDYISPNGDGRQDGLFFYSKAVSREEDQNPEVMIDSWIVSIKNGQGELVNELSGTLSLPGSIYFDGKDSLGNWLENGECEYSLGVVTSDGIKFVTEEKIFTATSTLDGKVVITSPKDNTVTSRGVLNIQGQAPIETTVYVCVDMVWTSEECDDELVTKVDENGFFTAIVPISKKESYIWAQAVDRFGNESPKSNVIKIILDFSEPLISVQALPALCGISQNIIFRSVVTQNTENVHMEFAGYSNLTELPESSDWYEIGELREGCALDQCVWDYNWKSPGLTGGVYEIEFTGRKAELVKTMSIGIRVDGTIPDVPVITNIRKNDNKENLRPMDGKYYTNDEAVEVSGIGEPLTKINLVVNGKQAAHVKADPLGYWSLDLVLEENANLQEYLLSAGSVDAVGNESASSIP